MFAPDQDVTRFGNRQLFNEYGMRSRPVVEWGDDRRIFVFGDSVLNGGNLTDHSDLATTRASESAEGVTYANISAGSWGIDNILGWIESFGLMDADTVILVLSSHDSGDAPSFDALNPLTHPTERPASALWEGATRYAPRYLPSAIGEMFRPAMDDVDKIATEYVGRDGLEVIPDLVDVLRAAEVNACVVLHATIGERQERDFDELNVLASHFEAYGVPYLMLPDFDDSENIEDMYSDDIHINEVGQAVLESALVACDAQASLPSDPGSP